MGTFLFKWPHKAEDVHVTGTFDDWSKSVQLEKKGDIFEKLVTLPSADKKIYYKFVVDGTWTTDHTAPQETDSSSNVNNVLLPEHITKPGAAALGGAAISTFGAGATTAALADNVPKESSRDVPGGFPETPAQENPEFGVKPIPATAGAGNPISLKPGEQVPDPKTITTKDTTTADTLDKEGYEKAGSSQIPPSGGVAAGETKSAVPPVGKGVIPESSLPMGAGATATPTIQSAGAGTSTAALAANVPKEPRGIAQVIPDTSSKDNSTAPTVPEVVKESIAEAHTGPEAAADKTAVQEKAQMEQELLKEVKPTDAAGQPAPAASAAVAESAPAPTAAAGKTSTLKPETTDSRDISPMSRPDGSSAKDSKPTVTTGVSSGTAPGTSSASASSAKGDSNAKKNRASGFFGKLKDRLKH